MDFKDWATIALLAVNALAVTKLGWQVSRFISKIEFRVDELWKDYQIRIHGIRDDS